MFVSTVCSEFYIQSLRLAAIWLILCIFPVLSLSRSLIQTPIETSTVPHFSLLLGFILPIIRLSVCIFDPGWGLTGNIDVTIAVSWTCSQIISKSKVGVSISWTALRLCSKSQESFLSTPTTNLSHQKFHWIQKLSQCLLFACLAGHFMLYSFIWR